MRRHLKGTVKLALIIAVLLSVIDAYAMQNDLPDSLVKVSKSSRPLLLGDIHQVGDIANIEGDATAHQLQAEVNIAHDLIKNLSRQELEDNLDSVAEMYQRRAKEVLWHALSYDHQQQLLSTFCSLEEIKKGLLFEHDLLKKGEYPRSIDLYYAAAVFDRPFQNKINFKTMKKTSEAEGFHFKEGFLVDYDEALVNQAFLSILAKSINASHPLLGVPSENKLRFTVQIHRGTSGVKQANILIQMLKKLYGARMRENTIVESSTECLHQLFFENNIEILFRSGYLEHTLKGYMGSSFVLSLGLAMGLNPEIPSGKIVLPDIFIPFNQRELKLFEGNKRQMNNRLGEIVQLILADEELQTGVIQIIAEDPKFQSQNKRKIFKAQPLKAEDFVAKTTLLIINDIWNPIEGDEKKTIKRIQSKL